MEKTRESHSEEKAIRCKMNFAMAQDPVQRSHCQLRATAEPDLDYEALLY